MKRALKVAGITALVCVLCVGLVACKKEHKGTIRHGDVDFLHWSSGAAYTHIHAADITMTENHIITVKVPHGYDMVNKGVELDMKKFFDREKNVWGKDLEFRRSDLSYAAKEVGLAYERKADNSAWVRVGVTPEEVWTENGGEMSSRVMLAKGSDGKILNYIFFGDPADTSKRVIYTISGANGKTYTLTVKVEKKTA